VSAEPDLPASPTAKVTA